MRYSIRVASLLTLVVATWSCGGGSSSSYAPTTPSTSSGTTSSGTTATTITITSINGAQSFSPNPASVDQGTMVVWHNADVITHRVVLNDLSIDTGNIAAGATSAPMMLNSNGANYHCSLHPTMVGSINSSAGSAPPCQGAYC